MIKYMPYSKKKKNLCLIDHKHLVRPILMKTEMSIYWYQAPTKPSSMFNWESQNLVARNRCQSTDTKREESISTHTKAFLCVPLVITKPGGYYNAFKGLFFNVQTLPSKLSTTNPSCCENKLALLRWSWQKQQETRASWGKDSGERKRMCVKGREGGGGGKHAVSR